MRQVQADVDRVSPAAVGSDVTAIDACLDHAMAIPGAIGACVVDYGTGVSLGAAGAVPDEADAVAAGATAVVGAITRATPFTSAAAEDALEDLIVTSASGYHLLRRLPTEFDGDVVLYLWLDRERGNLAVARLRLQDLGAGLVPV